MALRQLNAAHVPLISSAQVEQTPLHVQLVFQELTILKTQNPSRWYANQSVLVSTVVPPLQQSKPVLQANTLGHSILSASIVLRVIIAQAVSSMIVPWANTVQLAPQVHRLALQAPSVSNKTRIESCNVPPVRSAPLQATQRLREHLLIITMCKEKPLELCILAEMDIFALATQLDLMILLALPITWQEMLRLFARHVLSESIAHWVQDLS